MKEKRETEFISGYYPKIPHERTPDFVKGAGSFNVKQALEYFTKLNDENVEWVNYQTLVSKKDNTKLYAVRDFWEKTGKEKAQNVASDIKTEIQKDSGIKYPDGEINPDDIPF